MFKSCLAVFSKLSTGIVKVVSVCMYYWFRDVYKCIVTFRFAEYDCISIFCVDGVRHDVACHGSLLVVVEHRIGRRMWETK